MAAPASPTATLHVGTLTLRHCATGEGWCGTLERALDPDGVVAGTIPVHFEYYRHSGPGRAAGTLVATEGGPGFPATGSRAAYLALYQPLRATRDVVIMDNRGTGDSGAVDCPSLQREPMLTEAGVAACGERLGATAPFYSTTLATDDLAAVLDALGAGTIDLYGDSYGTFFAQVFAVRHGERLRSLVLDGAYPLGSGEYAWYPAYAPAMRDKFNLACQRSPACNALPGDSISHIEPALRALRLAPMPATARDLNGTQRHFTADAGALAVVMFGSAPALASVRELDAAARAYVAGDRAPLLRLMAESRTDISSTSASPPPREFSAGLAAAVMCQDAPQIFDMALPPAQRRIGRDRIISQREAQAPDTYAPFTIAEYRRLPLDYSFIDECVAWPSPPSSHPAGRLAPAPLKYPAAPTLVVSGDLDNMTPVADGAAAAANFPHATQVLIRNGFHVNALPHSRSECGATVVRKFIETLDAGDPDCARSVPPVRLVPRFARKAGELDPATPGAGNAAGDAALRAVSAALLTAGDALARAADIAPGDGIGLRGGRFHVTHTANGYHVALRQARWTEDLAVSGEIDWPRRMGKASAHLTLQADSGPGGSLVARWEEGAANAHAQVVGQIGGKRAVAELPAP
jgi:pimeloyl-ACP methyl ester carboxylesterase